MPASGQRGEWHKVRDGDKMGESTSETVAFTIPCHEMLIHDVSTALEPHIGNDFTASPPLSLRMHRSESMMIAGTLPLGLFRKLI
jgi:hypothetical protein